MEVGDTATVTITGPNKTYIYLAEVDENGTLRLPQDEIPERFKEYPLARDQLQVYDFPDMNMIWKDFNDGKVTLDELIELYICIGYSVWGFWEVFGWEVNCDGRHDPVPIYVDGLEYPDEWDEYLKLRESTAEIEKEKES